MKWIYFLEHALPQHRSKGVREDLSNGKLPDFAKEDCTSAVREISATAENVAKVDII